MSIEALIEAIGDTAVKEHVRGQYDDLQLALNYELQRKATLAEYEARGLEYVKERMAHAVSVRLLEKLIDINDVIDEVLSESLRSTTRELLTTSTVRKAVLKIVEGEIAELLTAHESQMSARIQEHVTKYLADALHGKDDTYLRRIEQSASRIAAEHAEAYLKTLLP